MIFVSLICVRDCSENPFIFFFKNKRLQRKARPVRERSNKIMLYFQLSQFVEHTFL